jgi:hypothetical protein
MSRRVPPSSFVAKSQFIQWEDTQDDDQEDTQDDDQEDADTATSCSPVLLSTSFAMNSPVLTTQPSQQTNRSPVFKSQTQLKGEAASEMREPSSKRVRRSRNLLGDFNSADSSASEAVESEDFFATQPGTNLCAARPTQFISDGSQMVQDTQEDELEVMDTEERVKGSDWIRGVESACSDDPTIESVDSAEARTAAADATGFSGAKKKKRKFGLAAKLEAVLKQQKSDLALREHVAGAEEREEIFLAVLELTEELFWTRARCSVMDSDDGAEMDLILQRCHLGADVVENLSDGCEIRIESPFRRSEEEGGRVEIYGVKKLEVLDQPIKRTKKRMSVKVLMSWDCECCDE